MLFTAPSDADRRAALAVLAAAGPAVRIPLPGGNTGWLVTGYPDVRAVLTDPRVVKQLGLFGGPYTAELPPGVAARPVPAHAERESTRPRAAAPAGRRGVHPAPGGCHGAADPAAHRRLPRRRPGERPGGPRRGTRRAPAGAGHRRPAGRARDRLPAVPRLDTTPGHRGAGRTGRLRRRRRRHARPPARARRAAPHRTRRRPAVRAGRCARRRRREGDGPARRGRADVGRIPAPRRRPRDHRQPHRERCARAAHPPGPAHPAAGPAGPAAGRRRGGAAPRRTRPRDDALRDHRTGSGRWGHHPGRGDRAGGS